MAYGRNLFGVHTNLQVDFPGGSDSKASAYNAETQIQSLDQDDLLEKEMATHSSILAWKISWTEEPGRLQYMESQRVGTQLSDFTYTFYRYTLLDIIHSQ